MQLTRETFFEFKHGNPRAFQIIFDCYRMRVFHFVKKLIEDRQVAEEITSDTFVKLHNLHPTFNNLNNVLAFLYVTARNAGLDYIKHRKRRGGRIELTEEVLDTQDPDVRIFGDTDIEATVLQFIHDEIEKLPPRSKTIFKLFYIQGFSLSEIAEKMNLSPQTIANQKVTALKQLRIKVLEKPKLVWALLLSVIFSKN